METISKLHLVYWDLVWTRGNSEWARVNFQTKVQCYHSVRKRLIFLLSNMKTSKITPVGKLTAYVRISVFILSLRRIATTTFWKQIVALGSWFFSLPMGAILQWVTLREQICAVAPVNSRLGYTVWETTYSLLETLKHKNIQSFCQKK